MSRTNCTDTHLGPRELSFKVNTELDAETVIIDYGVYTIYTVIAGAKRD